MVKIFKLKIRPSNRVEICLTDDKCCHVLLASLIYEALQIDEKNKPLNRKKGKVYE